MEIKRIYIIVLLLLLSGFVINSCVTSSNYKILSFFFDGVPNPDSTQISKNDSLKIVDTNSIRLATNSPKKGSVHPPYAERNCGICHDLSKQYKLVSTMPDLCYTCHEDFSDGNKIVHGPVASGNCTECHDAHSSPNEKMLLDKSQKLCFNCHVKDDIMNNAVHSDIDSTLCWTCHEPHSSVDKLFLK
jgi:predicted CXXCH cytochrome family protein